MTGAGEEFLDVQGRIGKRVPGLFAGDGHGVEQLPGFVARVRSLDNRALFEVPQILAGILRDAQRAPTVSAEVLTRVDRAVPAANDAAGAVVHAS
jgi:hypothetical protein